MDLFWPRAFLPPAEQPSRLTWSHLQTEWEATSPPWSVVAIWQMYHKAPGMFFCQPCARVHTAPKYSPALWENYQLSFILMMHLKFSCCVSSFWGLPARPPVSLWDFPALSAQTLVTLLKRCFYLTGKAYRHVPHLAYSATNYLWILGMLFISPSLLSWQLLLWNFHGDLPPRGMGLGSMLVTKWKNRALCFVGPHTTGLGPLIQPVQIICRAFWPSGKSTLSSHLVSSANCPWSPCSGHQ